MGAFCYLNVPLQDGLRDETFSKIFTRYMYVHVQSYNKKEKKPYMGLKQTSPPIENGGTVLLSTY